VLEKASLNSGGMENCPILRNVMNGPSGAIHKLLREKVLFLFCSDFFRFLFEGTFVVTLIRLCSQR